MMKFLVGVPTYGHCSAGRQVCIYIHQLCADTEFRVPDRRNNWQGLIKRKSMGYLQ